MLAPIVLFTYNRLSHVQTLIESLLKNDLAKESELFIFSDGNKIETDASQVSGVRAYIHTITGFKSIYIEESPKNRGLATSVIYGVSKVLERYDRVIVLEDDLILSPYFLQFMNETLDIYSNDERVGCVNGHMPRLKNLTEDTYFIHHTDSWGWGTWRRAWKLFESDGSKLLHQLEERQLCEYFDFDGSYPFVRMLKRQIAGQNSSWAIRFRASMLLNNKLAINAGHSLVINNGADGSGTHVGKGVLFPDGEMAVNPILVEKKEPDESMVARQAYRKYYRWNNSKLHKAIVMLQSFL